MTFRNLNKIIENQGLRFVQEIVENWNSIFHKFTLDNDQGNDCYIEFVENGMAQNYGVFVQIKSGKSFRDSLGYKIPSDKQHLLYWSKQIYKSIGIVFDPEINKAFWVDISEYIRLNPKILSQKNHSIRVSLSQEFSITTFSSFVDYCYEYKESLISYKNYGQSLELFANIDNNKECYEGLKSLYSNHRNKPSTWFYIISTFSKIKDSCIQKNIIGLLSNYMDNPDIYWHKANIRLYPSKEIQICISELLNKCFKITEVEECLKFLESGIVKGDFSYLVYMIISKIKDAHEFIKEICFRDGIDPDKRNFYFWLYLHLAKYHSIKSTLFVAENYFRLYPYGSEDDAIVGLIDSLKEGEIIHIG